MALAIFSSRIFSNSKLIGRQPNFSHGILGGPSSLGPLQTTYSVSKRLALCSSSIIPKASSAAVENESSQGTAEVPIPKVIIDLDSDPDATMSALKNLGLNVVKANVYLDSSGKHNKFAITNA
nr:ACT domain-containing protein DS12, chloroplastic [Ipomoea batatas]